MIPGNVFLLQIADFFSNRRLVVLRIGISVLLAAPFVLIGMPARAQASGIIMVIIFTSFFGAAVNYARLNADTRMERLILLPTSRWLIWFDLLLSSVVSRFIPAIVILSGFVVVNGESLMPVFLISFLGMLFASLIILTIFGIVAGQLSRNNGEVHLFGAIICVVVAVFSGITPMTEKLKPLKEIMVWNPIARLFTMLIEIADKSADTHNFEFVFASFLLFGTLGAIAARLLSGRSLNRKLDE